jgi:hypothetical protein
MKTRTIAGGTILLMFGAVGMLYFNPPVNQCNGTLGQIGQSLSQGDQQKCSAVQISLMAALIFLIAGVVLAAVGFVQTPKKAVLDSKEKGQLQ